MLPKALLLGVLYASNAALAQVVGSAPGFASGVTGGGDATPVTPADIDELVSYLTDSEPRVILLDKTYDFSESEGIVTETGCRPSSNTCPGAGGQDAINGADWCDSSMESVEVTYDVAATNPINIAGDKSIVGVGSAGVIKGKGLRLANGITNVIIQNIHITDLNPQYIWGGDALTLAGTDMVWIDHCTVSLIGRQMLVTGYDQAGSVSITNNVFDGSTEWSASCDGTHYWTMLFLGESDRVTLQGNHIYNTSGRSPKVGGSGDVVLHAVNNYWQDNTGHAFDIAEGATVLIEGNVFESVVYPITAESASNGGAIFNVPSGSEGDCAAYLGRDCVANLLSDSGDFGSYATSSVLSAVGDGAVEAISADSVADSVTSNAGIGRLDSAASSTSSAVVVDTEETVEEEEEVATPVTSAPAEETSAPATEETTEEISSSTSGETAAKYYQCGGNGFSGPTACEEGSTCHEVNEWYSQCL